MKGRQVILKPRKRVRPRHVGPAVLKPAPESAPVATGAAHVEVGVRELSLARALSDTEREARDASLAALALWLGENASEVSDADFDKLCKALFYCVWMADKRPIISQVIERVVGLADVAGWSYMAALFRCIVREWHGVDRHRVDKFYELITVALESAVAKILRETQTDSEISTASARFQVSTAKFSEMMQTSVFDRATMGGGVGVANHVIDYWVTKVVVPLVIFAHTSLPGNELHRAWDSSLQVPLGALGARKIQCVALSKRIVDRVVTGLPELAAGETLALNDKAQRDVLRRSMKKVWSAAASKESVDEVRELLYSVHATLKARAVELEAVAGVLPPPRYPPAPEIDPASVAATNAAAAALEASVADAPAVPPPLSEPKTPVKTRAMKTKAPKASIVASAENPDAMDVVNDVPSPMPQTPAPPSTPEVRTPIVKSAKKSTRKSTRKSSKKAFESM
jgi:Nucleolar protein,Nop52